MVYRVLRALAHRLLGIFYARVEAVGLERVPARGPLLLVANHHNALVDPLLMMATIPRRLVPVAKAPLFRHPLIGPLLRAVGALPAHRRQDAAGDAQPPDPSRNAALFASAVAALRGDRAILIFPEGVSQPEPVVLPLRTGAARMVLSAEAGSGGRLGVTVLPVGLVYQQPATFRAGRGLVVVGEPVPTADLVARAAAEPEATVHVLTDRLAAALRALIVEAEDRHTLDLVRLAEAVWREESGAGRESSLARMDWMRRVLRARDYLAVHAPRRVETFRSELERYAQDLAHAGLASRPLVRDYPGRVVGRYALREGLSLVIGLPLALWGMVLHAVPYRLTALAVRLLRPDADAEATYKIFAASLLFPLAWALESWIAWRLGGWSLVLVVLVALVPAGFFALAWQARLERVRRDARGYFGFLVDRDLNRRLLERRQALARELAALAELVPASVLADPAARETSA